MDLIVNDLLRIKDAGNLVGDFKNASWVYGAAKKAPLVVVRRAPYMNGLIPVGIRGKDRNERMAAFILYSDISEVITPEQLAEGKLWRKNKHMKETQMFKTLESVNVILEGYGMTWGPTGSVGFELASGISVINKNSDLDIVIRVPNFLTVETAKSLEVKLLSIPAKMDVQLETSKGSIALAEYARELSPVLIRTVYGPRLIKNPWSEYEHLEE